jgi:hypothetical protein
MGSTIPVGSFALPGGSSSRSWVSARWALSLGSDWGGVLLLIYLGSPCRVPRIHPPALIYYAP